MMLHPLEDIETWLDDMTFDDDSTPLGRGHVALFLNSARMVVEDVTLVMGRCTSR
jgi:hypothetical protein